MQKKSDNRGGRPSAIRWVFEWMDVPEEELKAQGKKPPSPTATTLYNWARRNQTNRDLIAKEWLKVALEQPKNNNVKKEPSVAMKHVENLLAEWEARK
jgi:hypothetical protein